MSQQQIPPPSDADRAIDLQRWWYLSGGTNELRGLSHLAGEDVDAFALAIIRRCHAAETELTAERQRREAAETELEGELTCWKACANVEAFEVDLRGKQIADLERQLATVRAETVEECAAVCQKEGEFRQLRATQRHDDGEFGQERIQHHKAITAFALSAAIRRLNATTTEPQL
jgi:hypothetical protein